MQKKLPKECAGITTGWSLLNKIVILMLGMRLWVLCEYYIWTKGVRKCKQKISYRMS